MDTYTVGKTSHHCYAIIHYLYLNRQIQNLATFLRLRLFRLVSAFYPHYIIYCLPPFDSFKRSILIQTTRFNFSITSL